MGFCSPNSGVRLASRSISLRTFTDGWVGYTPPRWQWVQTAAGGLTEPLSARCPQWGWMLCPEFPVSPVNPETTVCPRGMSLWLPWVFGWEDSSYPVMTGLNWAAGPVVILNLTGFNQCFWSLRFGAAGACLPHAFTKWGDCEEVNVQICLCCWGSEPGRARAVLRKW